MPTEISVPQLEVKIRELYFADPANAQERIESHLKDLLRSMPLAQRIALLDHMAASLGTYRSEGTNVPAPAPSAPVQQDILANLFLLLLGEKASQLELQSEKQLERLADALNTIFDSLNELITVINTVLKGSTSHHETIRGIIGLRISNRAETASLGEHLGQIKQAFLLSREAMKDATRAIAREILEELDASHLSGKGGVNRLGPFRKAKLLDIMKEKHKRCRNWLETDQFESKLSREFEKHCTKRFST